MAVNIISMVHQRGPKYELVIEDLMKNTPPEFEDRDALGEALVSMKATNTLINSCVMGVQKDVKVKVHKNVVPRVRVCSSRQLCLDKKVSGYRSRGHIITSSYSLCDYITQTFFENKKVNDFGYNVLGYAKLSHTQR